MKKTEEHISAMQAAQVLGVSRSRITYLTNQNLLEFVHEATGRNPRLWISLRSVLLYKESDKRRKHSPKSGSRMPSYLRNLEQYKTPPPLMIAFPAIPLED